MRKAIVIGLVALVFLMIFMNKDQGTRRTVDRTKIETIRGDVSQLQGKSTFYHNRFGNYPVYPDDVYEMNDGHVIWGVGVMEKYFGELEGDTWIPDKEYISDNIKLINLEELKDKDLTYELANKDVRYYLDILTGKVICPELMEEDPDYTNDITDDGKYKVLGPVIIEETADPTNKMQPVHGSIKSGTTMYFYGGGSMKLAQRNENTREIIDLKDKLKGIENLQEILYIQPTTNKASVVIGEGNKFKIAIVDLKL